MISLLTVPSSVEMGVDLTRGCHYFDLTLSALPTALRLRTPVQTIALWEVLYIQAVFNGQPVGVSFFEDTSPQSPGPPHEDDLLLSFVPTFEGLQTSSGYKKVLPGRSQWIVTFTPGFGGPPIDGPPFTEKGPPPGSGLLPPPPILDIPLPPDFKDPGGGDGDPGLSGSGRFQLFVDRLVY